MVDIPVLYINRKLVGQLIFASRKKIETKTVETGKPISLNRIDYGKSKIDFTLTPEDMSAIADLDKAETLFFSHRDPEMVKWLVNLK